MNKKTKRVYICLVVLLIIIVFILGVKFMVDSAHKINIDYETNKNILKNNYDNFYAYIADYNEMRSELASIMESAMYYEKFPKLSDALSDFYLEYDQLINQVMISVKNMDKACKREYKEEEYNAICESYQLTYEKMINVYIDDINTYNNLIKNYNEWIKEEKYILFTSNYINDYIDYNNDLLYESKIES